MQRTNSSHPTQVGQHKKLYEKLEDRVLFDAVPDASLDPMAAGGEEDLFAATAEAQPSGDDSVDLAVDQKTTMAEQSAEHVHHEIVFVDQSVAGYEQIVADLVGTNRAEVRYLDAGTDGVAQIARVLANRNDLDAIHIISHGKAGELKLGSAVLTSASIDGVHADELAIIGNALSEHADLLIYGCNFGAGEVGQSATRHMSERIGADVASSDDLTGHVSFGGDWDLEINEGHIETIELAVPTWKGILVDTDLDGVDDAVDIDDDNDGILDSVEQTTTLVSLAETIGYSFAQNSSGNQAQHYGLFGTGDGDDPVLFFDGDLDTEGRMHVDDIVEFSFGQTLTAGMSITLTEAGGGNNTAIAVYVSNGTMDAAGDTNSNLNNGTGTGYLNTVTNGLATLLYSGLSDSTITLTVPHDVTHMQLVGLASHGGWAEIDHTAFVVVAGDKDTDGDGVFDHLDLDSDNDGISDLRESGAAASLITVAAGDGTVSLSEAAAANAGVADLDGDGLMDIFDADDSNITDAASIGTLPIDTDFDGLTNTLDLDSDADGIPDTVEARPTLAFTNNDADTDVAGVTNNDADGDGVIDLFDANDATTGDFGGTFVAPVDTDGSATDQIVTSFSGEVTGVATEVGIGNSGNATGAPDGIYAELDNTSDVLVLDLGEVVAAGTTIQITAQKAHDDPGNELVVSESDASGTTLSNTQSFTFAVKDVPETHTYVTTAATQYIDLSFNRVGGKLQIDGVEWSYDIIDTGTFADYRDTNSDDDAFVDADESGLTLSGNDANKDGIDDAVNAAYVDPDGDINDPINALKNNDGDAWDADYRSLDIPNVPPVIDLNGSDDAGEGYVTTFVEGDAPVAVADVDATVTDVNDLALASLTITAAGILDGANEVITITGDGPTTISFPLDGTVDPTQQVTIGGVTFDVTYDGTDLTVVGNAGEMGIADVHALIAAMTYENTGQNPTSGDRTLDFVVNDGDTDSNLATSTITVDPVNDAPAVDLNGANVGKDFGTTYAENDTPVNITDGAVDVSDLDDTAMSSLTFAVGGILDGDSEVLTIGGAAFSLNAASTQTVTAGGTTFQVVYDGTGGFTISDNGGGDMPVVDVELLLAGTTYQNTSEDPSDGDRTIEITISDPAGASASATSTVNVDPVNDPPVVSAAIADRSDDDSAAVSLDISGNFDDVDAADTLTYSATGLPPGLSLDPATGIISGTLDASASSGSTYTVQVTASDGTTSISDEFIWTATNPAPSASDNTASLTEDLTLANSGNLLSDDDTFGSDTDPDGDPLSVASVNGVSDPNIDITGSYGTLAWNSDGSYTYTLDNSSAAVQALNNGRTLSETFTYTVDDGDGGTDTAFLTVTINGTNDPPNGVNDVGTTDEKSVLDVAVGFGGLLDNDWDLEGDSLTISEINGSAYTPGTQLMLPSGALLTVNSDGSYSYDPNGQFDNLTAGETAGDSFTYTVEDGNGGSASPALDITIVGVNDPPNAMDDFVATPHNEPITVAVAENDNDPDGDPFDVILLSAPTVGETTVNGDGTITYTPQTDFVGSVEIRYQIEDPAGATGEATLTIDVLGPFTYDWFNNFSEGHGPEPEQQGFMPAERLLTQEISRLAPEPIFSGSARPGTQVIGRIYNSAGILIGESASSADVGGNWMMQFHNLGGMDYARIEFQEITGTSGWFRPNGDIYGYLGIDAEDNNYAALEPWTRYEEVYDFSAVYRGTAGKSLARMHRLNQTPVGFGGLT